MKKVILVLLIPFVLFGCSNDDDNVAGPILGTWELISVENEAVYTAPDDEEVNITFEEAEYKGNTAANEFGGEYSITSNRLYITNSYTSELEDTEWGRLFYEALRNAYDEGEERSEFYYTLQGQNLTLRSDEDVMIFTRQ